MERQLINQGYIIALIALCRLKMERELINQGYIIHSQKRTSCSKSAAGLLQLAIIKAISGCVRIACSGLMISSLLQVVNRLDASCELQT